VEFNSWVDESGKKTAVVIDLKRHGRLWEDFYDNLLADERKKEPREKWDNVKEDLRRSGKLDG
jgi:hypothetical protein